MMKILFFMVVFNKIVQKQSEGLRCAVCENQPTNEDCFANGAVVECYSEDAVCQTKIRHEHGETKLTERCKQSHACGNNFDQTPKPNRYFSLNLNLTSHKAYPLPFKSTLCKPILVTYPYTFSNGLCNLLAVKLSLCPNPYPTIEPFCDVVRTPEHCTKRCFPGENNMKEIMGTQCKFHCERGYLLVGSERSECGMVKNRMRFDEPAPSCMPNPKCPPLRKPHYGKKSCDVSDRGGSRPEPFEDFPVTKDIFSVELLSVCA
ncbi:unnamed protein product [Clavelina lepadiformis]|uniref:Sushi domain-containing protein n=1 Tax=Clavelina lepadiformis TaxID=159417 RepID=A0ABP0F832_CLALP